MFLFLPVVSLKAQVQVTKSTEKVVVDGKTYYRHTVLKGQTAFSISKAYGITVDELNKANPSTVNGTREGEVLRIPVKPGAESGTQSMPADVISKGMIYHYILAGETIYSLSRRYKVEEEDILKSNPGLNINEIAVGTRIAIPVSADEKQKVTTAAVSNDAGRTANEQRTSDGKNIYHKVQKGETLSSLSREYKVSLRDIKRANKGLLFPKEGDFVLIPVNADEPAVSVSDHSIAAIEARNLEKLADTIPVIEEESTEKYTSLDKLRGSVRVAVLLPFYVDDYSQYGYSDSSDFDMPFMEMYEGILIAADSLRSIGLKVELDVYDTGGDTVKVQSLIESGKIDDVDLILGPVYSESLQQAASFASERNIPVVSPVPLRDQSILNGNSSLFKICPSYVVEQNVITSYVSSFSNSNIVLLYSDSLMYDPRTISFRNKLTRSCWEKNDTTGFKEFYFSGRVFRKTNKYIDAAAFENQLVADKENVIIIATNDLPKVSAALSILHSLSRRYNIRVAGSSEIRETGIETIDLKYLYDLRMVFPSEKYIDYSRPEVASFVRSYYKKFRTEPDEDNFAWRGFDMAYYFIAATARYGHGLYNRHDNFRPALSSYDFCFSRVVKDNGFENQNMFVIQYNPDRTITVTSFRDISSGSQSTTSEKEGNSNAFLPVR